MGGHIRLVPAITLMPQHMRSTDTTGSVDFRLGRNDQAITMMLASQARMELDIARIMSSLAERRGERRTAIWAAGAVGSIAMFLLSIIARKLGFTS